MLQIECGNSGEERSKNGMGDLSGLLLSRHREAYSRRDTNEGARAIQRGMVVFQDGIVTRRETLECKT